MFLPRNAVYVSEIGDMWSKHLIATGTPIVDANRIHGRLINDEFLALMNGANDSDKSRAARALATPIIELTQMRTGERNFELPSIVAIRQKLATRRS
jgi:hypothetical protein